VGKHSPQSARSTGASEASRKPAQSVAEGCRNGLAINAGLTACGKIAALYQGTTLKPALRGCDFFVFAQKSMLKTNGLRPKKSWIIKKVTNSERSRRVPQGPQNDVGFSPCRLRHSRANNSFAAAINTCFPRKSGDQAGSGLLPAGDLRFTVVLTP
jgi:hypothetical protein